MDNLIMDSLYNVTTACTGGDSAKQTYGQGVLVGLVSGLMSTGQTFDQVLTRLGDLRKQAYWFAHESEIDWACVPVSWRETWTRLVMD